MAAHNCLELQFNRILYPHTDKHADKTPIHMKINQSINHTHRRGEEEEKRGEERERGGRKGGREREGGEAGRERDA
jgi:hypothetical protein